MKEHINSILNNKKTVFCIIGTLIVACIVVSVCFFTSSNDNIDSSDTVSETFVEDDSDKTLNEDEIENDENVELWDYPIKDFGMVFDENGVAYRERSHNSVIFSVSPNEGEISDNLYKCITGEKNFQYIVEQLYEDKHVEYVSIEQSIMDFTYALPFLESDGTQIRMDMEFKEYAISDLDGDETDELIYYVYPGGDGYFLIFHDFGETVCAYGLRYRSVRKITYDGCMEGVDGASRGNLWKITSFSTSGYDTEEISKFDSDKDEYIVLGEPVSQEEAVSFFRQNYDDKEEIKWIK